MTAIWPSLWLSLRIALLATVLVAIVAVPLAHLMARRRFPGKSLVESLITLPLVLPPTVVGYLLIVTLGSRGWLGRRLDTLFDYNILFTFEGAVLAAAIVALPLLYLPAKAAFATVERELEDIARLYGANPLGIFWHVSIPLARRGILSGLLLAFARALGEFGATAMVFGIRSDQTTLPILIYYEWDTGHFEHALAAVLSLVAMSLGLIAAYNYSTAGRQE
jgi:molybdate transport system permease protein